MNFTDAAIRRTIGSPPISRKPSGVVPAGKADAWQCAPALACHGLHRLPVMNPGCINGALGLAHVCPATKHSPAWASNVGWIINLNGESSRSATTEQKDPEKKSSLQPFPAMRLPCRPARAV